MRLLPEIDLANIAALPREHRQPALRAFKAGTPRFSYRLVRQAAPDIFNAQSELLGTIPPTDFEQIRRRMQASGGSIQEIKANLAVAESLHAYTTCNTVSAKRYYISPFQLSGAVGIELCYWLPLVLVQS